MKETDKRRAEYKAKSEYMAKYVLKVCLKCDLKKKILEPNRICESCTRANAAHY